MEYFLQDFLHLSSWQTVVILFSFGIVVWVLKLLKDRKLSFSLQMLVALVFGIVAGVLLQALADFPQNGIKALKDSSDLLWLYEVHIWLGFFISVFISILKLLIIPLVFVGIVTVLLRLQRDVKLGAMLGGVLFWLVVTTSIASLIGIILGVVTGLGVGVQTDTVAGGLKDIKGFSDVILGLIPSNIIVAMNTNNIVGVVIFAFLVGFGARSVRDTGGREVFYRFFQYSYEIIMHIAGKVIDIMPYMVILMITNTILIDGFGVLISAMQFILLIYTAMLLVFVVHGFILFLHGLSPLVYFKKALTPLLMAFSSRSSAATLPITITTLTQKLGVSQGTSSLGATLGTTMGMNGCAGYFAALVSVFMLNALQIPIGFVEVVIIVTLSVIASVGIAGIPGITIMIISVILTGLGLEEHFALLGVILAVDPLVDMARTTSNVSGSMVASIATDKELKMLDMTKYKAL